MPKLAELLLWVLVGIICVPGLVMAIINGCWGKKRLEKEKKWTNC